MHFSSIYFFWLALLSCSASAHYIFDTVIYGHENLTSTAAVRIPKSNSPVQPPTSSHMTCNDETSAATDTVTVPAGSIIGFKVQNNNIFHPGPAAIYLGAAPDKAENWDGSGRRWTKIAEWGATYNPFKFVSQYQSELVTTVPENTPQGEFLARVESWGLHITGKPEAYISCAQIKVTPPVKATRTSRPGATKPQQVSIPGYIKDDDMSVMLNIWFPTPTNYRVPGMAVWRG